jgi:hypothetical protein
MRSLPAEILTFLLLIVFVSTLPSRAQEADGFTVQEKAGIALVKPQPWSKDAEATVLEFLALTDRTVRGTPGAGYYEFRTKQTDRRQVSAAKVVKILIYPDPQRLSNMTRSEDREVLGGMIADMERVAAQFPASRTYTRPYLDQLRAEAAEFDSGKVKLDGRWMEKDDFLKTKATELAQLIRSDIQRAKVASDYNLKLDPKYVALKELAGKDPAIEKTVAQITATYNAAIRSEERATLLAEVAKPEVTFEEAVRIIEKIRKLEPTEDPKAAQFVERWDASVAAAGELTNAAAAVTAQMETEMAEHKDGKSPPTISAALTTEVEAVKKGLVRFLADNPPVQIPVPRDQIAAMEKTAEGLARLSIQFDGKKYFDIKITLDTISPQAKTIGPNTATVIAALQRQAQVKIEEFTKMRDEGILLADSNKLREGLEKLEAAYEMIADETVLEQITKLRDKLAPKRP